MSDTILLGKIVYNWLCTDANIQADVNDRIYPITVTDVNTEMPFIVYSRTGLAVTYSKDGIIDEVLDVEFVVVARDYESSVNIANDLRHALECKSGSLEGIHVNNIHLVEVQEDFVENTFWQILKFKFFVH